jgi:WD40 repeat protein
VVNTYYGHTGSVISLAVLTGGTLASLGNDSPDNCFFQWTLSAPVSLVKNCMNGALRTVARNPYDGKWALTRTGYNDIIYESTYPGGWPVGSNTYTAIDMIPSTGTIIAVGATLDMILVPSGSLNFTVSNGGTNLCSVRALPDNLTVVVGQTNGLIKLFNTSAKLFGAQQTAHTAKIVMLMMTPDLGYLISAAADNKVVVWVWTSLTQVSTFSPSVPGTLTTGTVIANPVFTGKSK